MFLFFGVVAVVGSYYVQTEELTALAFELSVPIGLLAAAILMVNNIRDLDTDRRAGKRTLAVRLGRERARRAVRGDDRRWPTRSWRWSRYRRAEPWILLSLAVAAAACPRCCARSRTRTDGPSLNGALAGTGRLLAVYSLLLSAGSAAGRVKIERLEIVPYALRFREPYVTARGRLERRELLLVRLHSDGGRSGSARRRRCCCAAGSRRRRSSRSSSAAGRCSREPSVGRRATLLSRLRAAAASRRSRWPRSSSRCSTCAGSSDGRPLWRAARRRALRARCPATRPWWRASPQAVAGERAALGRARLSHLQAQGGRGRRRRAGAGGARGARRPGRASGVDANGAWTEAQAVEAPATSSSHFERGARRAAGGDTRADGERAAATGVRVAADESVADRARTRAQRSHGGRLRLRDGQDREGRRPHAPRWRSPRSCRSTSRARSTGRSGSRPRRTLAQVLPRRRRLVRTASRPRSCSTDGVASRECELSARELTAERRARASASRSTRRAGARASLDDPREPNCAILIVRLARAVLPRRSVAVTVTLALTAPALRESALHRRPPCAGSGAARASCACRRAARGPLP